jgi:hypothetical protein
MLRCSNEALGGGVCSLLPKSVPASGGRGDKRARFAAPRYVLGRGRRRHTLLGDRRSEALQVGFPTDKALVVSLGKPTKVERHLRRRGGIRRCVFDYIANLSSKQSHDAIALRARIERKRFGIRWPNVHLCQPGDSLNIASLDDNRINSYAALLMRLQCGLNLPVENEA